MESGIDGKNILDTLFKICDSSLMSKEWKPVIAYANGENLTLKNLKTLVCGSPRVTEVIDKIFFSSGVPRADLQNLVQGYLDNMGHYRSMTMIRWVGLALCKILKRNYKGIIVNEEHIDHLKQVMGSTPVLLLPSHKSYADFILMSFLCYYYDIEIPVIAAGEDFRSMWAMGRVLRECCAFFIKRTFGYDDLYKATISEYVNILITGGHSAMEFFIEGTRSRSGKSLIPKQGLMTMALEPYFRGDVPDITIIPVSITYEHCLEDHLFARELLGVPKPKESTTLLLKALKYLSEDYGRIFVKFGKPMSVKAVCDSTFDKDPRVTLNQASRYGLPRYPTLEMHKFIQDLSYLVVQAQNQFLTFAAIHLIATSISIWCSFENKVPMQKLMNDMKFFQSVLVSIGAITYIEDSLEKEIMECMKLHQRVMYIDKQDGNVKLHCGMASSSKGTPVWQINTLSEITLSEVYPAMIIQQYANPVCLKCIKISILLLILSLSPEFLKEVTQEQLFAEYIHLRQMFAVEFVLQDRKELKHLIIAEFQEAFQQLLILNVVVEKKTPDGNNCQYFVPNEDRDALLLGLIHPFLKGYALALDVCIEEGQRKGWVPDQYLKIAIQKRMECHVVRGVPKYILSRDLIANALCVFVRVGLIAKRDERGLRMLRPLIQGCLSYRSQLDQKLDFIGKLLNEVHGKFATQYKKTVSKL